MVFDDDREARRVKGARGPNDQVLMVYERDIVDPVIDRCLREKLQCEKNSAITRKGLGLLPPTRISETDDPDVAPSALVSERRLRIEEMKIERIALPPRNRLE